MAPYRDHICKALMSAFNRGISVNAENVTNDPRCLRNSVR